MFGEYGFMDAYSMFFIYGLVGWIVEVIYYGVTEGRFINRGFLNGPICPVYGIGFYFVINILEKFASNAVLLFFASSIICTTVELIAGVILFRLFHLRWWDYSDYKLNFKGFICVRFSIYWGIACLLGMKILHPSVLWLLRECPDEIQIVILCILTGVLLADIIVSVIVIVGLNKKIELASKVSENIRVVSDGIGSKIYGSVDTVINAATPTVNSLNEYRKVVVEHRSQELALQKENFKIERQMLMDIWKTEKNNAVDGGKKLLKAERFVLRKLSSGGSEAKNRVISAFKGEAEESADIEEIIEKSTGEQ